MAFGIKMILYYLKVKKQKKKMWMGKHTQKKKEG